MLYDKNSFVTENNAVRNGRKREVIMSRYTKNDIFRMVEDNTKVTIPANKRNYRKQKDHIKVLECKENV